MSCHQEKMLKFAAVELSLDEFVEESRL